MNKHTEGVNLLSRSVDLKSGGTIGGRPPGLDTSIWSIESEKRDWCDVLTVTLPFTQQTVYTYTDCLSYRLVTYSQYGDMYFLSFDIKSDVPVHCYFHPMSNSHVSLWPECANDVCMSDGHIEVPPCPEWTRVIIRHDLRDPNTEKDIRTVIIGRVKDLSAEGKVSISKPKFEFNDHPTEYTPAPWEYTNPNQITGGGLPIIVQSDSITI